MKQKYCLYHIFFEWFLKGNFTERVDNIFYKKWITTPIRVEIPASKTNTRVPKKSSIIQKIAAR